MGLVLFPDMIRREAADSTAAMEADNRGYITALSAINDYLNDSQLQGSGWEAMRRHLSRHRTVIRALLLANKAMIEANETLSDKVGNEILIEDKLRAKIRCLETINSGLRIKISILKAAMCASPHSAGIFHFLIRECEEHIRINLNYISILERKIEKLYRIEAETADLFDRADALYGSVNSAIAAIRQEYQPDIGSYSFGVDYAEFEKSINKQWNEGFKEINEKYNYEIARINTEKFFENTIIPVAEWLSGIDINPLGSEGGPVAFISEDGRVLEGVSAESSDHFMNDIPDNIDVTGGVADGNSDLDDFLSSIGSIKI